SLCISGRRGPCSSCGAGASRCAWKYDAGALQKDQRVCVVIAPLKKPRCCRGFSCYGRNFWFFLLIRLYICPKDVSMVRSEEHTSELQSRENLVCGRLLETK